MIMQKRTDTSEAWYVYFPPGVIDANYNYIELNSTGTGGTTGSTPPTSTTFNPVSSSGTYIAYIFADVAGAQQVGVYTGNGSTTGTSVTTGFEPRFLLIKSSTSAGTNWTVLDKARTPNNPMENDLKLNSSVGQQTGTGNNYPQATTSATGFQVNTTDGAVNGSGETYVYLAIA